MTQNLHVYNDHERKKSFVFLFDCSITEPDTLIYLDRNDSGNIYFEVYDIC